MKPHSGYRLWWLVLHGTALGACHFAGFWVEYWVLFAAFEGLALGRRHFKPGRTADGTWSWTTWAFLEDGTGFRAWWRLVLVGAWSAWLVGTFLLFAPLPDWVKGPVALGFGVWLWSHLFGRRIRPEAGRGTVRVDNHSPDHGGNHG